MTGGLELEADADQLVHGSTAAHVHVKQQSRFIQMMLCGLADRLEPVLRSSERAAIDCSRTATGLLGQVHAASGASQAVSVA